MPMFKRGWALLLLMSLSACGGSTTAPTSFTITVTSPDTNVLFGATEQMTASASDGRALTGGTWSSDTPSVATVSPTGLVTPTGAGQATVIFTASSGQQGTKVLRGLPNLNGTFSGTYTVTSCTMTGQVAEGTSECFGVRAGTSALYTFTFTQSADVVSGRFVLASPLQTEFDNLSGTIGLGGNLTLNTIVAFTGLPPAPVTTATWTITVPNPQTFGGTFTSMLTETGLSGYVDITASIGTDSQTASLLQRALPLTLKDAIRALTGR